MAAFFTNLAPALESIADKVTAGQRIGDDDALALLACDDLPFLGQLAGALGVTVRTPGRVYVQVPVRGRRRSSR